MQTPSFWQGEVHTADQKLHKLNMPVLKSIKRAQRKDLGLHVADEQQQDGVVELRVL
jgi:hypothetical protein